MDETNRPIISAVWVPSSGNDRVSEQQPMLLIEAAPQPAVATEQAQERPR